MILDLPLLDISLSSVASWLGRPSFSQSADQSTKCTRAFFSYFRDKILALLMVERIFSIGWHWQAIVFAIQRLSSQLEGALDEIVCSSLASDVERVESGAEIERRGKKVEEKGRGGNACNLFSKTYSARFVAF